MRQQVFKFSNDGKKLLMTLGEPGVAGNDDKHFGRPTDIAWLPDGTFYVTDGYTNTRVVKFDRNGKYLMTWGTPGTGPSQFDTVHSIAIECTVSNWLGPVPGVPQVMRNFPFLSNLTTRVFV